MCQDVGDHPENRANQNQEGDGIGGSVTKCSKHKDKYTYENHSEIWHTMFICLCKNAGHHVHFRHSLADTCKTIYSRVLGADNSKGRNESHPHLSCISQEISTVKQMGRCRIFQFCPWGVVVKAKHHHRLHQADQGKSDHHTKGHISLGIFYVPGYRNHILCTDKQPESNCHCGHNTLEIHCHTIRLMHHFPSSKPQHSDHSQDQHRPYQKKCYQILDLGKHIHTIQVCDHNHHRHNERIHQAWNR